MPVKPSPAEELYFAKMEYERQKKLHDEKVCHMNAEEKKRMKELCHMRCPKCGSELVEIEYHSVKIDRCVDCEGIWLDHGELDVLIQSKGNSLKQILKIFS